MAEWMTLRTLVIFSLLVPATHCGGQPGSPLATAAVPLAWLRVEPGQLEGKPAVTQRIRFEHSDQFPSGVKSDPSIPRGVNSNMADNSSGASVASFISGGYESYQRGGLTYSITLQAYNEQDGLFYHICGGALISENKVLTAAHCWDSNVHYYRVGVGWKSLSDYGSRYAQTINVIHVALHPDYNMKNPTGTNQRSDLAMLTLERNVTRFSSYVPQILRPTHRWNQAFTWWRCDLSGWGKPHVGATTISAYLKHGKVAVMRNSDCKKYFSASEEDQIYTTNLCTLNYPDMISGCEGDGGAPLVCDGNLAGILSWGLVACNGCTPDVFTRVSLHKDWIEEQIKYTVSDTSTTQEDQTFLTNVAPRNK